MVRQAIAEEDKAAAQEAYKQAVPIIDHGSSEGVLHRNAAARHKSRLNAKVRALGG
jgi:small subunit ribosomal protein S20